MQRVRCLVPFGILAASWIAIGCATGASYADAVARAQLAPAVRIVAWTDLPKSDERSRELSSIAWSSERGQLLAISDEIPWIVSLTPEHDWAGWRLGSATALHVPGLLDTEALAISDSGFFVASEIGPRVVEVSPTGESMRERALPDHFKRARPNQSLESIAISPSRRWLVTANEAALEIDGPPPDAQKGSVVRLLVSDLQSGAQRESAYLTDPVFAPGPGGEVGLVELAFIDDRQLLALERAYVPGVGNAVRVYRTTLDSSPDVLHVTGLSLDVSVMPKQLVVDLATLDDKGFPAPVQPEPTRLLENFEGMAVGPATSTTSRLLFLVSDDNGHQAQVARVLVLEVPL